MPTMISSRFPQVWLALGALLGLSAGGFRADAATWQVTTTADDHGACLPADCSLREAVLAARETPEADLVEVPPGFYPLTLPPDPIDSRTGALYVLDVELEIRGLPGGEVVIDGGGLDGVFFAADSSLKLVDLTVQGGNGVLYGGMVAYSSELEILRCHFRNNRASNGFGGGLRVVAGQTRIFDSSFLGNTVERGGGGIDFNGITTNDTLLIVNSTLAGNSALNGGGIAALGSGYLEVVHTTLAGNTATNPGSAFSSRIEHASFKNSLIAGNACSFYAPGTLPLSNGGNLESPGSTCFDPADGDLLGVVNPFLGTLGAHGGKTPSFELLPASPAIDRAVTADCAEADQRGLARPQGASCDIGAFELEEAALAPVPALGPLAQGISIALLALFAILHLRKN